METVSVALLARELAQADTMASLAGAWLRAACNGTGIEQALCYWHERAGDRLIPIAHAHMAGAETLSPVSLGELDNPVVYCLRSAKPCHVAQIGSLIDVGTGFDALREHLVPGTALLVLPIQDVQQEVVGVFVLIGGDAALRAWQADPTWQELTTLHHVLMARLQASSDTRSTKKQPRSGDGQEQARAARLLAAGFVGVGPTTRRLRDDMLRLADSSLSLLITGETGSGKDHAAWLIHQASSRQGKFVPVNCAAIPKDLIEAELFGAVRGAYTGATQARTGLVAEADGGTLFLDEIGDMPLELQGTLLRLLNEKTYRPIGATREQASDFRLICATHRPLPELVRDGAFREDLYFRIRQRVLRIPPLRERPEDIPALVAHVLLQHNRECQGSIAGISARALARLQTHTFPGNVRELRSVVLAAAERTAPGKHIRGDLLADLEEEIPAPSEPLSPTASALQQLLHTDNLPEALLDFERLVVGERLRRVEGSRREAALSLGIPKRTLARKCLEWNLNGEDHPS
ncbi:Fis family transcriptional regulator [Burkholderia cepacia]|uniref:sigma 54-interacting transcriptional regulator n=1 Tax=Burkholderia cepacia TaxID=292 RepID=UPI00075C5CAC|nr:sigma-54 dependent transcriptional regulator [Burkholderia cepacia]KVV62025.1 Fis family transcriptional regulator [Burkholderia cepacia]KVV62814.1 Fis family transcriptional regulator [Burkholderia cepacia]KVV66692.1 Fis family transcriptional regulator [Burkholderia cepacia]KVV72025.1 Fis family transcriptional regulator [Burkholderia cepacia]KVV78430.1 Fis family transcriptional regulator [Burkholderia cepacia]